MDWRFDFLLFKERRNYVAEALYQAFNGKLDHSTRWKFSIKDFFSKSDQIAVNYYCNALHLRCLRDSLLRL